MIDVHSHILNNVDDGSNSEVLSIDLLKKAENAGFTDIILTPHFIEGYYNNKKNYIRRKIEELEIKIDESDLNVNVYQGNEILLTENTSEQLKKGIVASLAGSKYILFELPFSNKMLGFNEFMYNIRTAGFIPVLAHPERYTYIQQNPQSLIEIIKSGVLIQSNYGTMLGQYGKMAKQTLEIMLENHLVHFMGSDTHRQSFVYESMDSILSEIRAITGDEEYILDITTNNPEKIINNLPIQIDCPEELKKKKRSFFSIFTR